MTSPQMRPTSPLGVDAAGHEQAGRVADQFRSPLIGTGHDGLRFLEVDPPGIVGLVLSSSLGALWG